MDQLRRTFQYVGGEWRERNEVYEAVSAAERLARFGGAIIA